jgi:hypothetical protein
MPMRVTFSLIDESSKFLYVCRRVKYIQTLEKVTREQMEHSTTTTTSIMTFDSVFVRAWRRKGFNQICAQLWKEKEFD